MNACSRAPSKSLAALLAALLAAGCATQKSIDLPDLGEWETRQAVLAALDRWDFNGRVGVQAGDDGFNGKLRWRQDGD
ncbi:MAG: hypothetical protein R3358_14070, partial [Woeseiaceae bacterium]|nr:hypothetical protein [Woeseiaceae bacterium]